LGYQEVLSTEKCKNMEYRRFGLSIFIRILLIIGIGIVGFGIVVYSNFWMLGIWIVIIDIVLFLELFRFIKKYYNEVNQFINNLSSNEFSYVREANKRLLEDDNLKSSFIRLEKAMQNISVQKERNYLLLKMVVDAVKTAFVCFDDEGKIFLINRETKLLFGEYSAKQIDKLFEALPIDFKEEIKNLKPGRKISQKLLLNNEISHLLVEGNMFILEDKKFRLLTFSDIKREMIEQEIGSYQKLTRVINHEIMNSAIPISNLTSVVKQVLGNKEMNTLKEITSDELDDIKLSLNTIESRTNGLVSFIKAVKSFNSIKKSIFVEVDFRNVVDEVLQLFRSEIQSQKITVDLIGEKSFIMIADKNLIEQLLINIIKNAIEALKKVSNPKITINFNSNKSLKIKDNGIGISPDKINEVFVPFYTTKKEGSGIGLSVCRQIMILHKGEINISSIEDEGTIITLSF
jgi:signal transduction histidine kinase